MYFYAALDPEFDLTNPEALEKPKVRGVINIKMQSLTHSERSWHAQKWCCGTEEDLSLSNKVCQGSEPLLQASWCNRSRSAEKQLVISSPQVSERFCFGDHPCELNMRQRWGVRAISGWSVLGLLDRTLQLSSCQQKAGWHPWDYSPLSTETQ